MAVLYKPPYPHDENKYKAACKWLGYAAAFPKIPLPQAVYRIIAEHVRQENGQWFYDSQAAALTFLKQASHAGVELDDRPSPKGWEFFLKHLLRGMVEAHKAGATEGPAAIVFPTYEELAAHEKGSIYCISRPEYGNKECVCFGRLEALRETALQFEHMLDRDNPLSALKSPRHKLAEEARNLEIMGAYLQANTHFDHLNQDIAEWSHASFCRARKDYTDAIIEDFKQRQESWGRRN